MQQLPDSPGNISSHSAARSLGLPPRNGWKSAIKMLPVPCQFDGNTTDLKNSLYAMYKTSSFTCGEPSVTAFKHPKSLSGSSGRDGHGSDAIGHPYFNLCALEECFDFFHGLTCGKWAILALPLWKCNNVSLTDNVWSISLVNTSANCLLMQLLVGCPAKANTLMRSNQSNTLLQCFLSLVYVPGINHEICEHKSIPFISGR